MKPQDAPIDVIDSEAEQSLNAPQPDFTARVGRAFVWTQLLRIVEVGTSALFLVLVIRKLGPTEYGIFGVIVSVTAVANMIAMFGFSDTLHKFGSEFASGGRHDAIAAMARRIIGVALLLASLCCVLLWVFREQIGRALQHPGLSGLYPIIAVLVFSQTVFALLSSLNIGLWRARIVFVITGLVNILSATGPYGSCTWGRPPERRLRRRRRSPSCSAWWRLSSYHGAGCSRGRLPRRRRRRSGGSQPRHGSSD